MLTHVPTQVDPNLLDKKSLYFPKLPDDKLSDYPTLKIFDSVDGGVHWINKEESVFSFILIPRKEAINWG